MAQHIDDDLDLASERPGRGRGDAAAFPEAGDPDFDAPAGPDPDLAFARGTGRFPLALAFVGSLAGCWFAGTSTADFVAHLDRQVHAIHCSVVPGAQAELGESGCRTVMLSPYSSWFRDSLWGGIPVSLWALAVFAFMAYRSGHLLWRGRPTRAEAGFLLTASALPNVMSALYGYLAWAEVGAVCTVCVGIYVSSAVLFVGALGAFLGSERPPGVDPTAARRFGVGVLEGVGFVVAMTVVYLAWLPDTEGSERGAKGCGALVQPEDPAGIMVDLARVPGGTPSIEVLDPLCPACRAFDERLTASGLDAKLDQRVVLFPLDSSCNWMVTQSLHPGACAVSEAMLCAAPDKARAILDWAFEHQESLLAEAKADEGKLRARLKSTFPEVASCLGTPVAKNKVVKSLQWTVANALPVMTPQLFVAGTRMCDEDTDLGLEYTLTRMLAGGGR